MTLYDGFMSVMTSVWSFETGVFDCCRYLTKATTHKITVQKFRANWSRRFRVIAPYSGFRTLYDGFKSVATSIWSSETEIFDCSRDQTKATPHTTPGPKLRSSWASGPIVIMGALGSYSTRNMSLREHPQPKANMIVYAAVCALNTSKLHVK